MADAHFEAKDTFAGADGIKRSGAFVLEDGSPVFFLPELPSESAPFELIVTSPTHAAPNHDDGHRHYAIGSDEATVDAIVAWYAAQGHPVPAGYKQATLDHAQRVKDEAAKQTTPPAA